MASTGFKFRGLRMARRVDANQKEIVSTFRSLGASVQILSDIGKGCPDIVVGAHGKNYLFEIKDGNKPLSAKKLTDCEQIFFSHWRGHVDVIESVEEVIIFMSKLK